MEPTWIEILLDAGLKLLLATLAMTLYGVWMVRDKLKVFNFSIFIKENKAFWVWTLVVIFIVLAILTIEPESGEALKTMTGLDVNNTKSAFLTLGWSLSLMVNSLAKDPIGTNINK